MVSRIDAPGVARLGSARPAIYAQAMSPPPKAAKAAVGRPSAGHETGELPAPFRRAQETLRRILQTGPARPELELEDMPAPQRLAPYSAAIAGAVIRDDEEIAMGRLIVLYDPEGRADWSGTFRLVAYVSADLEPEFGDDELIGQVAWSWLLESLERTGYWGASGTITRAVSEGFGEKGGEPSTTGLELRASWSPIGDEAEVDLTGHVAAWCAVMCLAAGLPPAGVSTLPPREG